jgi:hypothetical protein
MANQEKGQPDRQHPNQDQHKKGQQQGEHKQGGRQQGEAEQHRQREGEHQRGQQGGTPGSTKQR